jgi:hypothetical protein
MVMTLIIVKHKKHLLFLGLLVVMLHVYSIYIAPAPILTTDTFCHNKERTRKDKKEMKQIGYQLLCLKYHDIAISNLKLIFKKIARRPCYVPQT